MKSFSSTQKILITLGGLICLYLLIVGAYQWHFRRVILPGTQLEGQSVGESNKKDLEAKTAHALLALKKPTTLTLTDPIKNRLTTLPVKNSYTVNAETLWQAAYAQGRNPAQVLTYAPFLLPFTSPNISIEQAVDINKTQLRSELSAALDKAAWNTAPTDATFAFADAPAGNAPIVSVVDATPGERVDIDATVASIVTYMRSNQTGSIAVTLLPSAAPRLQAADITPLLPKAQAWTSASVTITEKDGSELATVSPKTIASWIRLNPSSTTAELQLDEQKAQAYFDALPSTKLQAPTNGVLEVDAQNHPTKIQPPTRGQVFDLDVTLANIQTALDGTHKALGVIETSYGHFEGPDAERLGIKDFLGIGHSNFAGSPSNRLKNIALGAKKVDSTIIPANTEFSLLHVLGPIDGPSGWLPELVIKGNKTTPEFGGGLCQIGTTIFRAALNTGLPITERQNHSYRVRYYEPAGTDATIYDPQPDFKFLNDTPNNLLVTKELTGNNVSFMIWGTKDGRVASSSIPVVSNIIQPPPKKIVESLDIPVGTTKCTETAHAGATAVFDYQITYANGDVKKKTFRSVYKPWQAVCLHGVAKLSTPATLAPIDETGANNPG